MSEQEIPLRLPRSKSTFVGELEQLLNRYSKENGSNTPDFILATYLEACLNAWDASVTRRENWYGRSSRAITERSGGE